MLSHPFAERLSVVFYTASDRDYIRACISTDGVNMTFMNRLIFVDNYGTEQKAEPGRRSSNYGKLFDIVSCCIIINRCISTHAHTFCISSYFALFMPTGVFY